MGRESLQVRWFLPELPLERHQLLHASASGPGTRTDWFASPCAAGWSIAVCGDVLVKRLQVEERGERAFGAARGRLQRWRQWELAFEEAPDAGILERAGWVPVRKTIYRQQFAFDGTTVLPVEPDDRPPNGCVFEWVEITVADQGWLSVALEAYGEERGLDICFDQVAPQVLPGEILPAVLSLDRSASYGEWLMDVAATG